MEGRRGHSFRGGIAQRRKRQSMDQRPSYQRGEIDVGNSLGDQTDKRWDTIRGGIGNFADLFETLQLYLDTINVFQITYLR